MAKAKAIDTTDPAALEAALPTLTKKLKELNASLTPEEQAVFSSIVNSAAIHLESLKAIESTAEVRFAKPISAVATTAVRRQIIALPKKLHLDE
ncbi:hypothetical protein [Burkholderia pseudomallei]|uniref:hypothetical protein n=1 Tax=Burkholderia pseudomallei TaxID=28450 RepID=UPI0003D8E92F|nr:hypothetical protein [Burkholderia pseudomallei]AHE31644.1 hypothetical protein BBJ_4045 [Burkholderia pseudomallei NCTC 13178]